MSHDVTLATALDTKARKIVGISREYVLNLSYMDLTKTPVPSVDAGNSFLTECHCGVYGTGACEDS